MAQDSSTQRPRADPAAAIRCFVALWPDAAARRRLDALAGEQQARFAMARRMRRENLHLTLVFIGMQPLEQAKRIAAALAQLPAREFDWTLDRLGAFAGAGVLWASGDSEPLQQLARHARQLLDDMAVPYDRKPFVPHVTLLRNLPRQAAAAAAAPILPPVLWRAAAPRLLQSVSDTQGIRYREVAGDG